MAVFTSEAQDIAKSILAGKGISATEALALVKRLKKERAFGYARKLLALVRKDPVADERLRTQLAQAHALCTYKDPDLPPDERFDRALKILTIDCMLATTSDQETLGQAGAIYKEKWKLEAQKQHLEQSLTYYLRGYAQGPERDYGYTGINAAFILDLLNESPEIREVWHQSAIARAEKAKEIRQDLTTVLPKLLDSVENKRLEKEWWFLVTVAEAYFGLQSYPDAQQWLKKAAALPDVSDWEREATTRQLAKLAQLHDPQIRVGKATRTSAAWAVLQEFLGQDVIAVRTAFLGKVGLALSGGGFRASLFHIGVLAKLAEWDVLRHVEVLSCVSGGSIIGAHYYLEARNLLQTKPDAAITRNDYMAIVQRLERDFLAGVQRNLRTRVAASLATNLKMLFLPNYSRTRRLGELYEKNLFARVQDREDGKERWLNNLRIQPSGEASSFSPKDHNWRRQAKVPILILNATSLNTGHNWQFTASYMGEPPSSIDSEVDGNYRLRRMYYEDAPDGFNNIRLGQAVAASSCVPGLFEPLAFAGLYPDRIVRLVDGGVYDNQGTSALLEQGCSLIFVSDASGQMESQNYPSTGLLGVPLRSNSILQARVRISEYHDLQGRKRASLLKGFMFVHLKKDLDVEPVDWLHCHDPSDPLPGKPLTPYGINRSVQQQLASIRTDLDSFSETEAYALMASGYRMTEFYFPDSMSEAELSSPPQRFPWDFLVIDKLLREPKPSGSLTQQLEVAKHIPFKVWRISRILQSAVGASSVLLLLGLFVYRDAWWSVPLVTVTAGSIVSLLIVTVAARMFPPMVMKGIRYQKTLQEAAVGLGMAIVGWLVAGLHLHVFDRWFLRQGRIRHQVGHLFPGRVAMFTGHMVDAPDRPLPRFPESRVEAVRAEIARRLNKLDVRYGFGSAARGSDLLFIEEILKRSGAVRVTLPFSRELFAKTSVSYGWDGRYSTVLSDSNVSVMELSQDDLVPDQESIAYQRCNNVLMEEAVRYAGILGKKPVLIVVWDGKPGDGAGGTSEVIRDWQGKGYELEHIDIERL